MAAALAVVAVPYLAAVATDAHLAAPPPTPIVVDRAGRFLTQVGNVRGDRVEYGFWHTPPPPRLVAATLALEDRRFRYHPGIDPVGLARAAWAHLWGGRGGASTIAMQVARMQHPRPRTVWAKAVEAGTAVALTLRYGHEAVLAQYVRLAPYGGNSHGIGHAARWYFDKPAADLSLAEAALLAAVPQSPSRNDLRQNDLSGPGGLARAAVRARRALGAMDLAPAERDAALAELAAVHPVPMPRRPVLAMHAVLRLAALARDTTADPADPRLHATLDLDTQATVTRLLRAALAGWRNEGAQQAAVMVLRRGAGGGVTAYVASAGWNSRPDGAIDYAAALRSPGSTLKPFLYAAALDRGLLHPAEVMEDAPEQSGGIANADNAFLGPLLPRQALGNSRNVPASGLLNRIGVAAGMDILRGAGLTRDVGRGGQYGLGLAVGAVPSRLDWLVRAYGALADDGEMSGLRWLREQPTEPLRRVVSAASARLMASFLSDPMARLPTFPRYGAMEFPFPVALKTGTSQQYRDSWTIAWTAEEVVGVWAGRPDAGPTAGLAGGRAAARLAQAVLLTLHGANRTDLVAGAFAMPPGAVADELCTDTGRPGHCPQRLMEFAGPTPRAVPGPSLAIVTPLPDAHVWRNPDAPPALQRLVLRAAVSPGVDQVVWMVDGEAVATVGSGEPFSWRMVPGAHRFQLRLPLAGVVSRQLRIVVE